MQGVLGKHYSDLVAARGLPDQKIPDGKGGEIWIYFIKREWTTPGHVDTTFNSTGYNHGSFELDQDPYFRNLYGSYSGRTEVHGQANTTYTPARTGGYIAHRAFFIDTDGIVYRYAWKGI